MKTLMAPFRTLAAVTKLQALISREGARISPTIRLVCRTRFRKYTQLQKLTMQISPCATSSSHGTSCVLEMLLVKYNLVTHYFIKQPGPLGGYCNEFRKVKFLAKLIDFMLSLLLSWQTESALE